MDENKFTPTAEEALQLAQETGLDARGRRTCPYGIDRGRSDG